MSVYLFFGCLMLAESMPMIDWWFHLGFSFLLNNATGSFGNRLVGAEYRQRAQI